MVMGFFRVCLFFFVATITLCITRQAFALECAVCLPSDEDASIAKEIRRLFPEDESTLIGCSQSNATDESAIVKTCPPESSSCHIQKTKEWIAKTCSRISVDDCKTANRVKYCYCKTDRCNMQNFTVSTTTTGAMTVETIETTTSAAPSSTTTPAVDKLHHTTSRLRPMDSTRKSNSSIRKSDHWLILSCLLMLIFRSQNKLNFTDKLYK
ncbi:uncharacterized protein LOC124349220 [Daphnia pulicaria]|uniref:uncharacterized protein LOC124349220 n=1 Tax=Daphnia pulicaria TaxID=35523 RepID=UPI001EEAFDDD|nr:uncharacterized protein LOC124349220 [Daphnia pulicaria]